MSDTSLLERRLERLREARRAAATDEAAMLGACAGRRRQGLLAERLARRLGGELLRLGDATIVRLEGGSAPLPLDRRRLASLPGQPPPEVPLICLDTETTGLGTATGTLVFLIGLGWWEGDRFRQVQLILPDQADEPALLAALRAAVPLGAWLVTYNGRTFDWPLLETRYRLRLEEPPPLDGHLDLLPVVRRLLRHRLPDARLRTVEREVLGIVRYGDVDGALVPARYLEALRLGEPDGLVDVVRHNDLDVLSLARLLAHLDGRLADESARSTAHPGDLAGLARLLRRAGRLPEALACLDAALGRLPPRGHVHEPSRGPHGPAARVEEERFPWWSPRARPDLGGRPVARSPIGPELLVAAWTEERLLIERARLLRRMERLPEAAETWRSLAAGTSRLAAVAAIELAKLQEHRARDPVAALASIALGWRILERRRRLGMPEPRLEADLVRRAARLRSAAAARRPPTPRPRRPSAGAGPAPSTASAP
jgi:hypothetical protein